MAFKQEATRLLQQAEADAMAPLKARLNQAIAKVGAQKALAFILNTDNNAAPYLNPDWERTCRLLLAPSCNKLG